MEHISETLRNKVIIQLAPGWKSRGYSAIGNKVVHNKKISITAKGIYWFLFTMCFQKDRCYSSYEFLARDLGLNRKTVYKYLMELRENKIIKAVRRGQGKPNSYILKW